MQKKAHIVNYKSLDMFFLQKFILNCTQDYFFRTSLTMYSFYYFCEKKCRIFNITRLADFPKFLFSHFLRIKLSYAQKFSEISGEKILEIEFKFELLVECNNISQEKSIFLHKIFYVQKLSQVFFGRYIQFIICINVIKYKSALHNI